MSTEEPADGLGSTEHDKAMVDKADETIEQAMAPDSSEEVAERPEWLPEKYENVDAFLEGHKNLEKKLGERDEVEPADESETEESHEEETGETKADPLDPFYSEFQENGELSDESYAALDKLGYNPAMVDTYINGYQSQIAQVQEQAYDIVGGQEEYDAMANWAVDNMTDAQLDAYHGQLRQGDNAWELALRGLHSKYKSSGDAPVERLRSGEKTPPNTGVQPFTSQQELSAAVQDRRYSTSPEYRKAVEQRLEVSDDATMGANIPNPYAQQG
jgi:hypothetical protein